MKFFEYGETELSYLSQQDSRLAQAIIRIGHIRRSVIPDLFTAIVFNIVGQQISAKAAETVWKRFISSFAGDEGEKLIPVEILQAEAQTLQGLGISRRKVSYIQRIAEACTDGTINIATLAKESDDTIRQQLISLPGIGPWTVDMLMIFALERPDIISWHDLAIRRGLMRLHQLETLTKEQYEMYRRMYSPYGTVASLYLWKIAHESVT